MMHVVGAGGGAELPVGPASKAALSMLTKTLGQETAARGRVLAVAPGAIRTSINQRVWSNPAGLADLETKIPMDGMDEPDEIARLVAVPAYDLASYATGTTVQQAYGPSRH